MSSKKQYPLRVDPELWSAVEQWASDELRSVNGQMEFIIGDALRRAGRLPRDIGPSRTNGRRAHDDASAATDTRGTNNGGANTASR